MDIYRNNRPLADLPVTEAVEFRNWEPSEWDSEQNRSKAQNKQFSIIEHLELEFLQAVKTQEGETTGYYSKQINISPSTGTRIRNKLVKRNLLKATTVVSEGRGRPPIILSVLPQGKKLL